MIETLEEPVRHGDLAAFIRYALMWVTSPTFLEEQKEAVREMEQAFSRPSAPVMGVGSSLHQAARGTGMPFGWCRGVSAVRPC